ncbi:hypothetical protein JVT61DRAFT_3740 [Boletus reticuloceps]|uniref:Uncharacterized protein n=1 Tax=Boletus reticuloceps TaxID=495285 RepID=A0A8I3A7V4_9AGAM|nr:hypothetical protein JVT61DRAFT_3740 [Boletus reticuloceps]
MQSKTPGPTLLLIQIEGISSKEDAQFYLGKVRFLSCPHRTFSEPPFPSQCVAYITEPSGKFKDPRFAVTEGMLSLFLLHRLFTSLHFYSIHVQSCHPSTQQLWCCQVNIQL